eukprot:scaffold308102_cov30-Tisochrysis_lutea.AAC.4
MLGAPPEAQSTVLSTAPSTPSQRATAACNRSMSVALGGTAWIGSLPLSAHEAACRPPVPLATSVFGPSPPLAHTTVGTRPEPASTSWTRSASANGTSAATAAAATWAWLR